MYKKNKKIEFVSCGLDYKGDPSENRIQHSECLDYSINFKSESHTQTHQNSQIEEFDVFIFELEEIKTRIKNIEWDLISNDWTLRYQPNQYSEYKTIKLNPKKNCSKRNPLYRKKEWLERIYHDKELQLDDQSIGQICGIHKSSICKWRKKHGIPTKLRGRKADVGLP